MAKSLGIVWSDRFAEFFFSPPDLWPVWSRRMRRFKELLNELGLNSVVDIIDAEQACEDVLLLAHDEDYVKLLKTYSELGCGVLDYGDTIVYRGILDDVLLIAGSTLKGLRLVVEGVYEVVYQPFGGLHHAGRSGAAGFCPVNDIAIAIEYAKIHYNIRRVAVVDVDVHHGDGTQFMYYSDPSVLKISLHMKAPGFYPGTGGVSELGEGGGYGYSLNVPLPPDTGDEGYQYAFSEVVPEALIRFKPDLIIAQLGVDGHKDDVLGGLRLTTNTYRFVTSTLKSLAEDLQAPLLGLGGGGYGGRSAEAMIACILGFIPEIPNDIKLRVEEVINEELTKDTPEVLTKVMEVVKELRGVSRA